MIHPDTKLQFIQEEVGSGVVATKAIPKGTIMWVLDPLDQRFSPAEVKQLGPLYAETIETYSYRNREGNYILCWDNARFVNHSFNSNCLTTAYNFEIAIRDIAKGEEITDDYGYLNISSPFTPLAEIDSDRKVVYPNDLVSYHKKWDAQLEQAITYSLKVEQPLKALISDRIWDTLVEVAQGKQKMDSILTCYFDPKQQS